MKSMILKAAMILSLSLVACTTAPKSEEGKSDIRDESAAALTSAENDDSTLATILHDAKAYAVFPKVGKGAIGVGGAYGKGALYEGGVFSGYCDLTQASIGLQLGGQAYTEIISFSTAEAVTKFKTGNFAFDAQATAVAIKAGSGANAKYSHGVAVFTLGEKGLMFEASVGGQKFSYQAK